MNDDFDRQSIGSNSYSVCSRISKLDENSNNQIYKVRTINNGLPLSIQLKSFDHGKYFNYSFGLYQITLIPPNLYDSKQKFIYENVLIKQYDNKSFERNIKIILHFNDSHPNIISSKYMLRTKNHFNIMMEYMPENLSVMIERLKIQEKPLEEEIVKVLSKQLLSALKFIHQFNVAHRDISPINILVDMSKYQLKIADFSTAIIIKPGLPKTALIDTNFYNAPELLENKNYGTVVDVWSAACVISYMCLQKPIFQDKDFGKPLFNTSENDIITDSKLNDKLKNFIQPDRLRDLLCLMFNYNYKNRITAGGCLNHMYFTQ